jgi:3-phenylpropionate/trans-cinnamate dioxygenase ferredoxin reductase subunit
VKTIAIIGAGQAGASLALALRVLGHQGPITIIGEEPALPYERPPLSKAYLTGKVGRERLSLRAAAFYDDNNINVVTGLRVEAIDRFEKRICAGAMSFEYDLLALTTGAKPRRFPARVGGDLPGVHVMRTLADTEAVASECCPGAKALVIGGGYIGLEAAASFRNLGMDVTLVEGGDRILGRVAGAETSDYFRALHIAHGVKVREGVGLSSLVGKDRLTGAILSNGETMAVDIVLVGIGVVPDVSLAEAAGLAIDGGIIVDSGGRTSDPFIWAAGDCTSFPYKGRRIRLESVQNAIEQAQVVAENMLGNETQYVPVPWFWSDQYDVKLQIAGLNSSYDRIVVRPSDRQGVVSHWYFSGDDLLAVDAMNDPRSFMAAKRLLERGVATDPAAIADSTINLKDLLPA